MVLVIDHQKQHQRCRQQTSNDTKQCGDYAIKPQIIKYWQKRGIIDDRLALKLRGSVVAPPLQLCFEHMLVEHPAAQRRYRSQPRKSPRNVTDWWGVCGRPDWSPANMYPPKWCRGHTQRQCRARTTKGKPCRAFAVKGGMLYKNHGGITRANMRIYLAREIRCRVRLALGRGAPKSHCRRSIESKATDWGSVALRAILLGKAVFDRVNDALYYAFITALDWLALL
jgi:hypothetical protein